MSVLVPIAAALGLTWNGRAWAGVVDGVDVRLEPEGPSIEVVLAHRALHRDLWISPARIPHQGTVLETGDPQFDRTLIVVTTAPGALAWFDAATRASLLAVLEGRDRCSGLRVRLHRDPRDPGLTELVRRAAAVTAHLARPAPALTSLFSDPVDGVRLRAAEAAGVDGIAPLLSLLPTAHRRRAAIALAAVSAPGERPEVESALLEALRTPDAAVVRALGAIGNAAALPLLRAVSGRVDAAEVRAAVARIRTRLGGAAGALSLSDDRLGGLSEGDDAGTLSDAGPPRR